MSSLNFLIAPDFAPEHFAGWHMLGTWLQRKSGLRLHLLTPASAQEQAAKLAEDAVDLLYANPFDAAKLIHELGYRALAHPLDKPDEMVIATAANAPANCVEDLRPGCRIALTDNHDVRLIGLRLLEPADLNAADIAWTVTENYQAAARMAIKGEVDAAFFMAEAYASLSRLTRTQLKPLIESALGDIHHVLLAHPRVPAEVVSSFSEALLSMGESEEGKAVLTELGLPAGFASMSAEQAEFMIDLMDTLVD